MTKDLNKEIVTLSYNSLNLPDTLQLKDGHMVAYVYDASGRKEQVTRVTMITSGITIPVGSTLNNANLGSVSTSNSYTKYASNLVYSDTHIKSILLPDGILTRTNDVTSNPPVFSYNHYVRDHLGNVRTVIDNAGIIKQVNNYYPFGMEYGESAENQSKLTYQDYLYGGKEFDRKFEINLYDFGARFYDATRSQWTTPDPLAEKYPYVSPYVYCLNNPICNIDPDGKDVVVLVAKDGANGMGHMAAIIQDAKGNSYYLTQGAADPNGTVSKMITSGVQGGMSLVSLGTKDMNEAVNISKSDISNSAYTDQLKFDTSPKQDGSIFKSAVELQKKTNTGEKKYNVITNNCVDAVQETIENGTGVNLPVDVDPRPNEYFKKLQENQKEIQKDLEKNK